MTINGIITGLSQIQIGLETEILGKFSKLSHFWQ